MLGFSSVCCLQHLYFQYILEIHTNSNCINFNTSQSMDRACLLPSSQAMTNVNNLYLPHASQPSEAETQIVAAANTEHWHATVSSPRPNKGYIIGWYMYRYSTASFAMAQLKNVPCSRSSVCPSVCQSVCPTVCLSVYQGKEHLLQIT